MKKTLIAIAAAASALTAGTAFAQSFDGSSPWMVRVRAVHLNSDNGGVAGDAGVSINNKWIPEVDVSYFFTPNIAAELILTYPQKHDVRLNGDKIGSLKIFRHAAGPVSLHQFRRLQALCGRRHQLHALLERQHS